MRLGVLELEPLIVHQEYAAGTSSSRLAVWTLWRSASAMSSSNSNSLGRLSSSSMSSWHSVQVGNARVMICLGSGWIAAVIWPGVGSGSESNRWAYRWIMIPAGWVIRSIR